MKDTCKTCEHYAHWAHSSAGSFGPCRVNIQITTVALAEDEACGKYERQEEEA